MKRLKKQLFTVLLALVMFLDCGIPAVSSMQPVTVSAASSVRLNKTKLTLKKGKKYQLKLKNYKKTVKWSSSNKKVATVTKKGKVTAKKAGKATITAKAGRKKYTCRVTVKEEKAPDAYDNASEEVKAVFNLINQERMANGLSELSLSATLCAAADARAKETAVSFSHTRPNGESCFSILQEKKYYMTYHTVGENIAMGYSTPDSVMNAWMNSPGHRANILKSSYSIVGIGYYYDYMIQWQHRWVQIFVGF